MTSEQCANLLSSLSSIIVSLAAIIATALAAKGINAYERELKFKDKYEWAKRLYQSIQKVREGFDYVRMPVMLDAEYPKEEQGKEPSERSKNAVQYAYNNRYMRLVSAILEIESVIGQMYWEELDKSAKSALLKPVKDCQATLQTAIQSKIGLIPRLKEEEKKEYNSILLYQPDQSQDIFAQIIQKALEPIEEMAKSHLLATRK